MNAYEICKQLVSETHDLTETQFYNILSGLDETGNKWSEAAPAADVAEWVAGQVRNFLPDRDGNI